MSITFKNVSYIYSAGTPLAHKALDDINVVIPTGKMIAIIGATGSGKSTLVQHLNALLLPTTGEIHIDDKIIKSKEKPQKLKALRKKVGLVFQFPEYQLFEETVLKDVCFGPLNFGSTAEEAEELSRKYLRLVGIDEEDFERSPLDLSGGQKRRVAIAGILASDPDILVLDEPTAGLDPQGCKAMMKLFQQLNKEFKKTILIVTHDMEQVLQFCDEVVVLDKGQLVCQETTDEFFKNGSLLEQLNINLPTVLRCRKLLEEKGFHFKDQKYDLENLSTEIVKQVKHHG
jgi:ABC-type cobalt transport system, ATPase component